MWEIVMSDLNTDRTVENGPEIDQAAVSTSQSNEIEVLTSELAESRDKYLRLLAEQENVRRRWEKEKIDLKKFSTETIIRDLLPVLDSLEQALLPFEKTELSDEKAGFVSGFSLVKRQLQDALAKHGLASISAAGENFDPNLHQAIQMIEFEHADSHKVHQEFQKGYLLNGRLVRPAMVSVAVPVTKKEQGSSDAARTVETEAL
jgi:molecular chaperone GrpE